jgi:PKD domain/IPT/TIG domain
LTGFTRIGAKRAIAGGGRDLNGTTARSDAVNGHPDVLACGHRRWSLDAGASTDPDGSIVSYRWSFGDGNTGTNLTTEHTYATAGTYLVELSVTDDRGAVGTATNRVTVAITAGAPTISSFAPASGPAGTTVDIHGNGFTGATSVAFNGTGAAFTAASDAEIHTTVPNGATTGHISVTSPSGTATSSSTFTVIHRQRSQGSRPPPVNPVDRSRSPAPTSPMSPPSRSGRPRRRSS